MRQSAIIAALVLTAVSLPVFVFAQEFVSLTKLPGIDDFTNATNLVNGLITITIVGAALLAVIQIIRGGFVYLTTEAVSSKGEARKLISDALTGLLLVLVSVLILTIINPDILNIRFLGGDRSSRGVDPFGDEERGGPIFDIIIETSPPLIETRPIKFICPQTKTVSKTQEYVLREEKPLDSFSKQCTYQRIK